MQSNNNSTAKVGTRAVAYSRAIRYLELIRFSHTVFALPFATIAVIWALILPNEYQLTPLAIASRVIGVLLCMVFARSAAMAFNRLVDARIDADNPRTAGRHLPSGQLDAPEVWLFFGLCSLGFVLSTGMFYPNLLPLYLSLPVLFWICGYSLAKRFTSGAHLWLGLSLGLAPICAWIAIRGEVVQQALGDLIPAVWLGVAVLFWVAVH